MALLVSVLWAPRAAWAEENAPNNLSVMDALALRLSDVESMPSAESFVTGGEPTAALLFALYDDARRPMLIRVRALRALSYFPADAAQSRLSAVIADTHAKVVLIREAALGLARCVGASAVEPIARMLSRSDVRIRRVAIEALASIDSADARAKLHAHRNTESDPSARTALDTALHSHPVLAH